MVYSKLTLKKQKLAFAVSFAKAGAKAIILIARNAEELEAAAQDLRNINPDIEVLARSVDIRVETAVRDLFIDVKSKFGTADVLINNAGSGKAALPVGEVDISDFWYVFVRASDYLCLDQLLTVKSRRSMPRGHSS